MKRKLYCFLAGLILGIVPERIIAKSPHLWAVTIWLVFRGVAAGDKAG